MEGAGEEAVDEEVAVAVLEVVVAAVVVFAVAAVAFGDALGVGFVFSFGVARRTSKCACARRNAIICRAPNKEKESMLCERGRERERWMEGRPEQEEIRSAGVEREREDKPNMRLYKRLYTKRRNRTTDAEGLNSRRKRGARLFWGRLRTVARKSNRWR